MQDPMPDLLCKIMHNLIDKVYLKIMLRSYVLMRLSTRNLAKIRQDTGSKYMQVPIVMVMQDHM